MMANIFYPAGCAPVSFNFEGICYLLIMILFLETEAIETLYRINYTISTTKILSTI